MVTEPSLSYVTLLNSAIRIDGELIVLIMFVVGFEAAESINFTRASHSLENGLCQTFKVTSNVDINMQLWNITFCRIN